jgi:hypothetical protein
MALVAVERKRPLRVQDFLLIMAGEEAKLCPLLVLPALVAGAWRPHTDKEVFAFLERTLEDFIAFCIFFFFVLCCVASYSKRRVDGLETETSF